MIKNKEWNQNYSQDSRKFFTKRNTFINEKMNTSLDSEQNPYTHSNIVHYDSPATKSKERKCEYQN